MPKTSLIIIAWNDKENLENCLNSILANISQFVLEIIVVDNGSTDGTKQMLKKFINEKSIGNLKKDSSNNPKFKLIENKENKGITVARNQGFQSTDKKSQYILFCDSDIIIKNENYTNFFRFLDINHTAGIVGAKLLYADGSLQYSCRHFPTFKTLFLRMLGKNNNPAVENFMMKSWDHNSNKKVDWVMGACMLIKRNVLNILQGFDESYFYGYDDVDFCLRAKKSGFETWYFSENSMTHIYQRKSVSGKKFNTFWRRHVLNAMRFLKRKRELGLN